jgi:hypothetical protein
MTTFSAGNWVLEVPDDLSNPSVSWAMVGQGQPGSRGLNATGVAAVITQCSGYLTTTVLGACLATAGGPSLNVTARSGSMATATRADALAQAATLRGILASSSNWF